MNKSHNSRWASSLQIFALLQPNLNFKIATAAIDGSRAVN